MTTSENLTNLSLSQKQALLAKLLQEKERQPEYVPLSFTQQRLWFLDRLMEGSPNYNIPAAVRLKGSVNITALERSIAEIVSRHDSLRTTFALVEGTPMQVIAPAQPLSLPIQDLRSKADPLAEAHRLASFEAQRPFDLAHGPLWRIVLLQIAEADYVLILVMHHIISDGWSVGIFMREMSALYMAFSRNMPPRFTELPIQYADFARWQRQVFNNGNQEIHLNYWKRQLAHAPALSTLPADYTRPPIPTYRGKTVQFQLSTELLSSLSRLSQQSGTTLFMTLLAAFAALLSRYSHQDDLVIGSPIANRTKRETEPLIGFFANTLALRIPLAEDPTFKELLAKVRQITLDAYTHQDTPFSMLVEELQLERDLSYTPLFQVMFVLQNQPMQPVKLPDLSLEPIELDIGTAKFDLTMAVTETENGLVGTVEYSTDLFTKATIDRLLKHFERLLWDVTANPEQPLSQISLLAAAEAQEILVEWNKTEESYPQVDCLPYLFEQQVAATSEATAVAFGPDRLSYRELNERANRLAHYLQAQKVGPEVLVAIYMTRSLDMLVAILAVLKAGGAYVPLDPAYPQERLAFILEDTQAPLLLTQRSLLTNLPSHTAPVICLDDLRIPPDLPVTNPDRQAAAHNLLYIIYTSGSTGRPKGVAITHSSAIALVNWAGSVFPAEALHTVLAATSICFDLSLFEFFVPLSQGGTVVLVETILDLPELPSDHQITLINTVPSAIRQLLEAGGVPDSVRYINLAGEALSTALVDDIYRQTQVTHVHDLYGPSEDTTYSTFTLRQPAGPATIGQPITNTKAYLLNSQLKPVPVGVPGEIYLGGAGLARGYYNRPKITAERFIPHPFSSEPGARLYRTGDLARYRPDGNIEFLGRIDHQVKIRGYRIELGEIETVLRQHPDIEEVVCLAREDNPGDKRLVAYLVATTAGEPIASADLRQYLAAQLPQYMVPNLFMWLDAFPLTPNGKVNRQKLPVPDVDDLPRATQYIAPRNLQETKLAMLWQDILGVEQAGVHDNFFELGGHSLLATQLVSRIREAFAVEVPLRALFEQPTVAGLSAYIVAAGEQPQSQLSTTTPPIIPDPDNEYRPLSFSQQRLWFLNQLDPENTAYHIPMALRLEGDLNEQVLKDSLSEIVRRHESLRMTFDLVDEEGPVQIIHAPAPVEIEVTDLQHLPFADREMEAQRLAAREARRPFNLVDGPLLRVKLYRLSARDTVILLNTHHVISDGWSIGVLVRELATLYTTFLRGLPSPLPDLPVQYSDFARWQHGWFKDAVEEQHLAYWKQQLADAPRRLHLPTDRPRPSVRGHQGRTHPFSINAKLVDKIKNLGRQANATLFMTLLTALSVLLARYSGQKDIVIGSPIANRLRPEVEPLIGFFANTIVFRTQIAGNPTFLALLEQVRQVALGAYAHQSMPFEKLVEDLQPERDMGYAPLFQVMFALQNMLIEETALPGLTIKPFAVENTTAKFDLLLTLIETKDGLQGGLEYNSDLFEAATIERMVKHYEKLLDELIAQPQRPVLDIPLLSREEKQTLLKNWHNGPVIDVPEPYLHQLFEVQAARSPQAVAVQDENQRLTYGQLDKLANRLANKLLSLNVKPGDCVGICLERSVAMVVSLLAVCKAGAAYVPLDPQYPEARLAYMLDNAEASILLTYSGFVDRFSQFSGVAIYLDNNQEDTDIGDEQPSINITPQYPAYVIYTSGSTGKPKGVLVSHTAVCNHLSWRQSRFPLAEGDAFLQKASFGFDISTWEIMAPLVTGARLILARPGGEKDPRYLAEEVARQKITTIHFSPAMLHHFVDVPELDRCVDLKYIFCGGESLTASLQKRVFARLPHVQLLHQYGPTEACIDATIWACDPQDEQPIIPIGRPIANTQVYILDENLEPVPIGVPGELYIGGGRGGSRLSESAPIDSRQFCARSFRRDGGSTLI